MHSTFTNVVISSTGTDIYSSIVGAIGSMKGPRHGGANLKVSSMMKEVIREIGYTDNDVEIKAILKKGLTDQVNDRTVYMKGIDASYHYEGYHIFRTEDLSRN